MIENSSLFRRKSLVTMFLMLFIGLAVALSFPVSSHATAVKVDPNDPKFASKNNSLLFATDSAHAKALQSVTSTNTKIKVMEETSQGRQHKLIYWDNLNDLKKTDKITIKYGEVGYYNGRKIKANFVLSDFVVGQNFFGVKVGGKSNYIHINYDLPQGFTTSGIKHFSAVMQLTYADDGKAVDLAGDSYISFSSLDGHKELAAGLGDMREFVSYEKMNSLPYYVTKNSAIGEYTDPVTKSGKVIGGITNPQTNDHFEDKVGAPTFTNATVSFNVKGINPKFQIGALYGTQWISFNSSTFWTVEPEKPVKTETKGGVNWNGKIVQVGDTLNYGVTQKVRTLNQDLLTRYTKFVISDKLPKEVDYVSAHIETDNNKKFDASGEVKYDASTNTVTYTANANTLNSRMRFIGESYTLVIQVKVNNKVQEGVQIKNTGHSIINTNGTDTNVITNIPPTKPSISKKIVLGGKEVDSAEVNYDESFGYKVYATLPNPSTDPSFTITDDGEDILDVDTSSVKVFDANSKADITSTGTLSVDKNAEKWSWTVPNNASTVGKKIYVTFNAKVKIDYANANKYLDANGNIVVPNTATLNTLPSNKVTVTPKVPPMNITPPRTGSVRTLVLYSVGAGLFIIGGSLWYKKF
ncbi:isopeptide-forming domain-containing fimbrial protein [Enterococcus raffinosus]|uniref:isopeptide-forming domain-containing fimbrial protein n=1 Tax=Enterococcus raffinosus TaxID=71452 RepID=UPI0028906F9A|nr:isopeptide-forming domain-containing fimbrial protein [Enterococcus raffinosus]MDT2525111.1 isopeptide-forming domain-containing fimbrial protein [Enterococcus raffinosus]MDT2592466.1 isopeptide-forming domain-containing fimbrial protein [Enterococcus raffinosus]